MNIEKLTSRCDLLIKGSTDAIDWMTSEENSEIVEPIQPSKIRNLNRITRQAQKLKRAVSRYKAVSVFGPSQAGKSFLVSVLARPKDEALLADFHGIESPVDYISEINPEGQGESTGLVTRFTMNRSQTPDEFPVKLSVLTESDIIRILCNSFYLDGEQPESTERGDEIAAHIMKFKEKENNTGIGLEPDDVWEIQEYINAQFSKNNAYTKQLEHFWEDIATIAPRLSRKDRTDFLSILWDNHEPFTELYGRLSTILDEMNHPEYAYAKLDSLNLKEESIIDVKTLLKLCDDTSTRILEIQTDNNKSVSIERSVLCALAAELEIPMKSIPHEIFKDTDLLDFPGARNRFPRPFEQTFKNGSKPMSELFLRGKVDYLFNNYVSQQEVTSMLLCIPPGNMDTIGLPSLIDGWISDTIGTDPVERAKNDNVLFFVLTKFDDLLTQHAGGTETSRFSKRIESSLIEKFGKYKDRWVENWGPGQPFNNCFWLRNPNYPVGGVIDYDENMKEIKIREGKESWISELRSKYLESDLIQKHFKDPQFAWESALSLNDGGVNLLLQEMMKVCKHDLKTQHINNRLVTLSNEAIKLLPRLPGETSTERMVQIKENLKIITDDLEHIIEKEDKFGEFIAMLTISQNDVLRAISRMPIRLDRQEMKDETSPQKSVSVRVRPDAQDNPRTESSEDSVSHKNSHLSQEFYIANKTIETWLNQLDEFCKHRSEEFGMNTEVAAMVIDEFKKGATRLKLTNKMSTDLSKAKFAQTWAKQIHVATLICVEMINRFVAYLGIDESPIEKRPKRKTVDGSEIPLFSTEYENDEISNLPEIPRNIKDEYWQDWVWGFDYLAKNNVDGVDEKFSDQFRKLREIINTLDEAQKP